MISIPIAIWGLCLKLILPVSMAVRVIFNMFSFVWDITLILLFCLSMIRFEFGKIMRSFIKLHNLMYDVSLMIKFEVK